MNITFFTPMLKLSGGNIVMFKYAEVLVKFGHKVTVIAPHSEIINEVKNGVFIKTFKKFPNKYFEHIFFQLIYLNKFYELTTKTDVIIPVFFPLAIHALYCKSRGKTKKVISLFQDYKEMYWFGRYIFFILGLSFVNSGIDKFIAVSEPLGNQIKQITKKEVVVIPNGIEQEYFYPRTSEKENYVLFVGSSAKNKGLKYFLEAFNIVKKGFPNLQAKIVSQNEGMIIDDDIEVINVGTDREKLGNIYSKALIYVSQSFGDSFGLPPLEAMASGTAVVLTETDGAKQYAINNVNSIVVPIKNAEQTAKAIIKLLSDDTKRKSLEKEGIVTAKKYQWEPAFNRFNEEVLTLNDIKNE